MRSDYSNKTNGAFLLVFFILNIYGAFSQSNEISTKFKEAEGPSPYVIWQWMNGVVTKEGITYDLEEFKKVGIKNVQQFLIGPTELSIEDPENTIFSEKWLNLMKFTLDECKRLGIDFGTHNCPGWSSSAAPDLKVEYSMQKLVWAKTTLSGNQSAGNKIARADIDSRWNYYKDICIIAIPSGLKNIKKDNLIIRTDGIDNSGRLLKALPKGEWTILRFGHTTTGHRNDTAPISGQGLEVDKLSKEALDQFWKLYPEKLLEAMGEHSGKTFKRLEIDSYEAGFQNWTSVMPDEFRQRSGYNLLPWLVVRAGYTLESEDSTRRFDNDWARVLTELYADNYYGYLEELVHTVPGLEFLVEPYGTGEKSFDETAIRGIGDMVMCEFWTSPTTWGWETLLPVSSNAHINGKKIVAAEAFTGQPQYGWQTDLADLKKDGDRAFCQGVNLFMLHASAHQPWPHVKPGMTMGWWGTQFGPSQTWWHHGAKEWIDYITRCQLLLQEGLFESDLCYLQLYRQNETYIPRGFKADICNANELINRFSVKENKLVLPNGKEYKLLVLPKRGRIELETARRIEAIVIDGAVVIGEGFEGVPGLQDFVQMGKEVRSISDRLFGAIGLNGKVQKSVHHVGKGTVYSGYTLDEVIVLEKLAKDIEIENNANEIDWIHRKDGNTHYYFISNQSSDLIKKKVNFRIDNMLPEIWNAETGEIKDALVWEHLGKHTIVTLQMKPNESFFVVFRSKTNNKEPLVKSLSIDNTKVEPIDFITQISNDPYLILNRKGTYKIDLKNGKTLIREQKKDSDKILLDENWNLEFEENRGAPYKAHFDKLISWNEHSEFGVKYFSGTAKYKKAFQLDKKQVKSKRIILDLGLVENLATVSVNNTLVKVLWNPPFTLDITNYCKEGKNVLEVAVTNLWLNRIIGDKYEPEDCIWGPMREFTYVTPNPKIGRNLLEIPEWVKNNTPRPSKNRITFSTMDFFQKDTPLLPSGLIGPVKISIDEIWKLK